MHVLYSLHDIPLGLQLSLSTIHPIEVCGTQQCYGNHISDVKCNTLSDVISIKVIVLELHLLSTKHSSIMHIILFPLISILYM